MESVQSYSVPGVRFILVVLSAKGILYDLPSLRQKILLAYPGASIFFQSPAGKAVGLGAPQFVDLLIDLTCPGQREGFLRSRRLRRAARVAVGRNAGWFRKRLYDRIYDEKKLSSELPHEMLERERAVQKKVLGLAGVPFVARGDLTPDLAKTIALELPGIQRLV